MSAGAVALVALFAMGLGFGAAIALLRQSRAAAREPAPAPAPTGPQPESVGPAETHAFRAIPPSELPGYRAVGGMQAIKDELTEAFDVVLRHHDEAAAYHVTWNGVLLYGPPGVGKTLLARATAGEFGLTLVPVSPSDIFGATRAEGARNVDAVFDFAVAHRPALLLLDEFDTLAPRTDDASDQKQRAIVSSLVAALERTHALHDVVVMATTSHIDAVDESVRRPGRFDRQIRVDLPDAAARAAVFRAALDDLPADDALDVDDLARRTEGFTPATIAAAVRASALDAFAAARHSGTRVEITHDMIVGNLTAGGDDRPTVEEYGWDTVILAPDVKAQLQELQYVLEDPDAANKLGIEPPSGVLLAGPPGNGKTTVAKVLAAQARCSFYPISAADITSKWFGQSEHNVARLFERAREHRPSIVFIDEIDGLAPRRGDGDDTADRMLTELLEQIDGMAGQRGILVVGATNRPDQIDPALLRGGRLSRTVAIPLPDEAARLAMLQLFTARMPLDQVDLSGIAAVTEGWCGGDLRALCQDAALAALVAARAHGTTATSVSEADFERALASHERA